MTSLHQSNELTNMPVERPDGSQEAVGEKKVANMVVISSNAWWKANLLEAICENNLPLMTGSCIIFHTAGPLTTTDSFNLQIHFFPLL